MCTWTTTHAVCVQQLLSTGHQSILVLSCCLVAQIAVVMWRREQLCLQSLTFDELTYRSGFWLVSGLLRLYWLSSFLPYFWSYLWPGMQTGFLVISEVWVELVGRILALLCCSHCLACTGGAVLELPFVWAQWCCALTPGQRAYWGHCLTVWRMWGRQILVRLLWRNPCTSIFPKLVSKMPEPMIVWLNDVAH